MSSDETLPGDNLPTTPHSYHGELPDKAEAILATLPTADGFVTPDFSKNVEQLDQDKNKIWHSAEAKDFQKDGKINFLHLSDSGKFTLTIIKPGSKTVLEAQIPVEMVAQVRENLEGMKDWNKSSSPETWDRADGDKDGNTYMFNRYLLIFKTADFEWKLQWEGRHKNRENIVEVRDILQLVKVPPIILAKR